MIPHISVIIEHVHEEDLIDADVHLLEGQGEVAEAGDSTE